MSILTNKQKRAIRSHYPHMTLRFRADGTVEGKKSNHASFGVLYTPYETARHLEAIGLLAVRSR